ncbi:hypothetical protein [Floridanema evergladense]|uniref:Uncharacterized protein n=1 Tax=Floridaenema evergladense BLCC-F167 TaxID=3153639 RepID=A0ABV4WUE0_9CYAN
MNKILLAFSTALVLLPLQVLAQPETEYGFPVSENSPGDLPCHMVTRDGYTLDLAKLCGGVPSINYSGNSTGFETTRKSTPGNNQSNWVEIGKTALGDRIFVDENSFRVNTRYRARAVRFRSRTLLSSPELDGTVKTGSIYRADCLRNSLMGSYTSYDRNNQIIQSNSSNIAIPVQPGSAGELLYKYACSKLDSEQ